MTKRNIFVILSVLVTMFIFSNSLKTAQVSSGESGFFVEILNWITGIFGIIVDRDVMQNIVRKSAHFLEFALQGFLLCGCFVGKMRHRIIYVLFFGLLTACTDEYLQLFFEGRGSQIQDVFIDFAGTVGGLAFASVIRLFRRKVK